MPLSRPSKTQSDNITAAILITELFEHSKLTKLVNARRKKKCGPTREHNTRRSIARRPRSGEDVEYPLRCGARPCQITGESSKLWDKVGFAIYEARESGEATKLRRREAYVTLVEPWKTLAVIPSLPGWLFGCDTANDACLDLRAIIEVDGNAGVHKGYQNGTRSAQIGNDFLQGGKKSRCTKACWMRCNVQF